MRVALIQFNANADKENNIRRAIAMTERAVSQGARFVLLPEVFVWRGQTKDRLATSLVAEHVPGPTARLFQEISRKHKVLIVCGSILEKASGTKVYNTSVLIGHGKIMAKYRKIHLFDAKIGDRIISESDCFSSGRRPVLAKAGQMTIGLSVCYDLRFPEFYRRYGQKGANVLTVPSCFTKKTGQAHWEVLLRARAIENLAYVLAPNQVGKDARGVESYGNSMIVAPWGEVIARASSDKEEIIYGDLDLAAVKDARRTLPGIAKN